MKRTLFPLLLLVGLSFFSSCHISGTEEAMPDTTDALSNSPASEEGAAPEVKPAEPNVKIIKVANLRFQVKDLQASSDNFQQQLSAYNAFIFSSKNLNSEERNELNYTIKVAPSQLDGLVKALQKESIQLDNLHISSQDLTMEYVDVQARIKAKQAVEQRYLDLLKQANKIADVLAIEQELKKVQEETEAMQARLNLLQHQTTYSTLHLSMYQLLPVPVTEEPGFLTDALAALASGWQLCRGFILTLLYLWPVWLIGSAVYLLYRRYSSHKSTIA
ncbi:DUF4349 domain-containing protein [Pontibacter qinzhouensis]|uniref:DUF4349 domain-containing protein n=1 Tax=Pontibacter qinzhouensis TaxID=2603253 RepID=A0A5C8K211_9BACT|nr:DUF4349 domain-containing protein [Pontibacter qinzhouensis]TXK44268.1 DUF4349 domain-containing protein [Pontibacter qinzhouensis]